MPLSAASSHVSMGNEDMGMMHFDCPGVQCLPRQAIKADPTVLVGYREGQQNPRSATHCYSQPEKQVAIEGVYVESCHWEGLDVCRGGLLGWQVYHQGGKFSLQTTGTKLNGQTAGPVG